MKRRSLAGRRVVVTGASSGIGLALARRLASKYGCQVLMTARRREQLEQGASSVPDHAGRVATLAGDITCASFRQQLLDDVAQRWGGLDILINNAGVGAVGPFATADPTRLRRIMEVNFFAPCELLRGALPLLEVGQQPVVANVGSVLGHCAVPGKSEYCASKFALHGMSDALRPELKRLGIDLVLISPNTTSSAFFDALLERQGTIARNPWAMSPDAVAERAIRAIRRGRAEVILSGTGKSLVWLDRLAPGLAARLVARWG